MTAMQDQTTPRRRDVHEVTRTPSGSGVLLSSTGDQVELNLTAMALLELCDGATTIEEMTKAVSVLFGLPLARARAEVGEALESMVTVGLVR